MSARAVADSFLAHHAGRTIRRRQLLDGNQVAKLACVLGKSSRAGLGLSGENETPRNGTPVPPGWHLVYFTPSFLEAELGQDGSDKSFNPSPPFTRRMWAGGQMDWRVRAGLKVGETVTEETRVVRADAKTNKAGDEFIVAGVEKEYRNEREELVLTDRREWVFRKEVVPPAEGAALSVPPRPKPGKPFSTSSPVIANESYMQTAISLFRFSALTFNAHQIHYSLPWVQRVEGHPDIVVHAPLNLILMLEQARKAHPHKHIESIEYRASSPLYAGDRYTVNLAESGEVWCERDADGTACLTGQIG